MWYSLSILALFSCKTFIGLYLKCTDWEFRVHLRHESFWAEKHELQKKDLQALRASNICMAHVHLLRSSGLPLPASSKLLIACEHDFGKAVLLTLLCQELSLKQPGGRNLAFRPAPSHVNPQGVTSLERTRPCLPTPCSPLPAILPTALGPATAFLCSRGFSEIARIWTFSWLLGWWTALSQTSLCDYTWS